MKNYILKTVNSDMTSYGGFKWPKRGIVKCPDWQSKNECGNGLHGALNGCGDGSMLNWTVDAIWLVAEVDIKLGIDPGGKWKFPEATVVFTGNQYEATTWLLKKVGDVPVIGCSKIGGDWATVSGGYGATVKGGDEAVLQIKYWDGKRYRIAVGYVGENGIVANTWYKLNANNQFEIKK